MTGTERRPPVGNIGAVLANLRRMHRHSRQVVETAVSQLFDAAARHPTGADPTAAEYRIEDLARLAGTTTRNIRVYRDRGLLPPPLRVGRVALFNDTHLTRLRLITSMLDRGYTIAHVNEMLDAWVAGKNIGDVLGLETAIAGTWTTERPRIMARAEAVRLIDDRAAFERLVALGVFRVAEDDPPDSITVLRPKLIEAFGEIHRYGISVVQLVDLYEQTLPHIDAISDLLVRAGAQHAIDRIRPGEPLPADTEIAELITMLVRFRTQAVTSVTATLASSIESTIETMVGRLLSEHLARS